MSRRNLQQKERDHKINSFCPFRKVPRTSGEPTSARFPLLRKVPPAERGEPKNALGSPYGVGGT